MNGFFFGILFSGDIDGGMMGAYDAKATVWNGSDILPLRWHARFTCFWCCSELKLLFPDCWCLHCVSPHWHYSTMFCMLLPVVVYLFWRRCLQSWQKPAESFHTTIPHKQVPRVSIPPHGMEGSLRFIIWNKSSLVSTPSMSYVEFRTAVAGFRDSHHELDDVHSGAADAGPRHSSPHGYSLSHLWTFGSGR